MKPKKVSCSIPFVKIVLTNGTGIPGYWHFESGEGRVSEDVLLDPDGLTHVLLLLSPC